MSTSLIQPVSLLPGEDNSFVLSKLELASECTGPGLKKSFTAETFLTVEGKTYCQEHTIRARSAESAIQALYIYGQQMKNLGKNAPLESAFKSKAISRVDILITPDQKTGIFQYKSSSNYPDVSVQIPTNHWEHLKSVTIYQQINDSITPPKKWGPALNELETKSHALLQKLSQKETVSPPPSPQEQTKITNIKQKVTETLKTLQRIKGANWYTNFDQFMQPPVADPTVLVAVNFETKEAIVKKDVGQIKQLQSQIPVLELEISSL